MKRARSRKLAVINNSRWVAYATAGAATALTGTQSAEAAIHYFSVNQLVLGTPTATYPFPLAGTAGFQVNHSLTNAFAGFAIAPGSFVGSVNGTFRYVSRFSTAGLNVSTAGNFIQNLGGPATLAGTFAFGQWILPGPAFAAIKFNGGAGTQYGWVRLDMNSPAAANSFTIVDYAYADPGEMIATGQIPEPGTLGLLALGAVGLLAWRNRRAQAAAQK